MKTYKRFLRTTELFVGCACFAAMIYGCGDKKPNAPTKSAKTGSEKTVKALPFIIEAASLSDMFKNNLKVSEIEVGVSGGTEDEWTATGMAIAEKVAEFGADSVKVTVRRSDMVDAQVRYRDYAILYYSPDLNRSVWKDKTHWDIFRADHTSLSTPTDAAIQRDFHVENQRLVDGGMDDDMADKKAGAIIAKRYHLAKDWGIPMGNFLNRITPPNITVDASAADQGLDTLSRCLKGKVVYAVTNCDGV